MPQHAAVSEELRFAEQAARGWRDVGVVSGVTAAILAQPARMVLRVQLLQPLARDVRVDRRRRDVGVAEQQLHDAQVGAVIEQMRRERMAQHVRRQATRRECRRARA